MTTAIDNAKRFDLHVHSTDSDGRFAPDEVVQRAVAGQLDVIAITDHDLCTRLDPGQHHVGGRTIHMLQGAEVSGCHDGREFHLLVYFPGEVPARFREFCEQQARKRSERYVRAIENIGLADLPPPDRAAREGQRSLTRFHLAQALVRAGHTRSVAESFQRHTGDAHRNVPPIDTPFVEAIRIAVDAGGITSWAHPPTPMLLRYLETFVEAGLHGIEVLRPSVVGRERRLMRRLARDHDLLLTGGSDWHGWHDANNLGLFAVHRAELQRFLDALGRAA